MRARTTLTLAHPVTVLGVHYESLSLRAPKRCDRRRVTGNSAFEVGIAFAARLASVPVAVLYALTDDDREAVGATVHTLLDQVL